MRLFELRVGNQSGTVDWDMYVISNDICTGDHPYKSPVHVEYLVSSEETMNILSKAVILNRSESILY